MKRSCSASTISNLEREQHPPTVPDQVNALVVALGLSPEALLEGMGVALTPPAAAKLPIRLVRAVLQLSRERQADVEDHALALLLLEESERTR